MRTLHSDLLTAQKSASRTPYLKLTFRSRDGATTLTYATDDATNRIQFVQQTEGRFDERSLASGIIFPVSAVIRLNDNNKALSLIDFRGYRTRIDWGFIAVGDVPRFSDEGGPPVVVMEQRSISFEGQLYLELYCASYWDTLRLSWELQTSTARPEYNADVAIKHILMDMFGRSPSAVIFDPTTGVTADYTAEAKNPTIKSNIGSIDDIRVLKDAPEVGDVFIVGDTDAFDTITIDISNPAIKGVGSYTIVWEYWNGSAFVALSNVVDKTAEFTSGDQIETVKFDRPSNWATTTINTQGPFLYVRARVSAVSGSITKGALATKVSISYGSGLSVAAGALNGGLDNKPTYSIDYRGDMVSVVQDMMATTLRGFHIRDYGFELIIANDTFTSPDYTYDSTHPALVVNTRETHVVPNRVIYTNKPPGDLSPGGFEDQDNDTASQDALGFIQHIQVDGDLANQAAALQAAKDALTRLRRDTAQGDVQVSMNVGQEIWDVVKVVDTRSGKTITGRVSELTRTYQPGLYQLDMNLGGLMSATLFARSAAATQALEVDPASTLPNAPSVIPAPPPLSSAEQRALRRKQLSVRSPFQFKTPTGPFDPPTRDDMFDPTIVE